MQERVGHGISSATGFPGAPRTPVSEFQSPYFPPPFHSSATAGLTATQQTAQEVFAAQAASAPHLVSAAAAASADPYNVTNLHNFQTSQVI